MDKLPVNELLNYAGTIFLKLSNSKKLPTMMANISKSLKIKPFF